MTGIDIIQLRDRVIVPVLDALMLDPHPQAAIELLTGTALQESEGGRYLAQLDGGPARSPWMIEPATHDDIFSNYLNFRPALANRVKALGCACGSMAPFEPLSHWLAGNLYYACAIARIDYLRAPEPLPAPGDIAAQAAFYKAHYNSGRGKATVDEYLANWRAAFPSSPATQKDHA